METITSKEELWKIIAQLRRLGQQDTYPGQPRVELGELERWVSREGIAHDWINSHFRLTYNDKDTEDQDTKSKIINVQLPKRVAYWEIIIGRPIGEFLFNDGFLVFEEIEESVKREAEQYTFLKGKGLPTLNLRDELLLTKEGNHIFHDILITDAVDGINVAELMKISTPEEIKSYLQEIAQYIKQIHNNGRIWGDANTQKSTQTDSGIIIGGWGFKPNPYKTEDFLRAKEITNFMLNSKSQVKHLGGIEKTIFDAYNPSPQLKRELEKQLKHDLKKHNNIFYNNRLYRLMENKFLIPVYEAKSEEIIEYKTNILNLAA